MLIASLFTIAMNWKQLKFPLLDYWIDKMWYVHNMAYYSAGKSNEICRYRDGTRKYYIESSNADLQRQTPLIFSHLWFPAPKSGVSV